VSGLPGDCFVTLQSATFSQKEWRRLLQRLPVASVAEIQRKLGKSAFGELNRQAKAKQIVFLYPWRGVSYAEISSFFSLFYCKSIVAHVFSPFSSE